MKTKNLLLELELATQSGPALEGNSDRGVFCHQVFSMCTQKTSRERHFMDLKKEFVLEVKE